MTRTPEIELTVINLAADLDRPGTLVVTLAQPLRCMMCSHTGPVWQVTSATVAGEQPADKTTTTRTVHQMMTEPGS